MADPLDHLLRTFAAVAPGTRVLDVGSGDGARAESLALLGLTVHAVEENEGRAADTRARLAAAGADAGRVLLVDDLGALPDEDAAYDWVIVGERLAHRGSRGAVLALLREARRVLAPGGWLYALVPAVPEPADPTAGAAGYAADSAPTFTFTPETLGELAEEAGLAESERARCGPAGRVHGIYRRVEAGTVG